MERVTEFAQKSVKVEHTVNVDDCVTLGTILASHLLAEKRIVAEEGQKNTLFPHSSCWTVDDTNSLLRVSSDGTAEIPANSVVFSKDG